MHLLSKGLILTAIVFSLILASTSIALAEGYNDPLLYTPGTTETPQGPHGGYTTTSNKCKECHAVHLATGSYMLTRANTRSETCDFCHGIGGAAMNKVVLDENGHGLNLTQQAASEIVAPDDTIPPYKIGTSIWGCLECHSVHDNQTVKLSGSSTTKLLKKDPNPGKSYSYYDVALIDATTKETTQTLSHWCSTCHNANLGSHDDPKEVKIGDTTTTAFGHDSSGQGYTTDAEGWANVDPLDGANNGPTCKQCHPSDEGKFPHSSGDTPAMLKSGSRTNQLDGVCSSCHNTASLQ